ncbi:MAG: hypothetical protein ACPG49_08720 [Chitinophagales bacterium]
MSQILFEEKQTYTKSKVILLAVITLLTSAFFIQLAIQTPYDKTAVILGGLISVGYLAGITFYLWRLQLKTVINSKKIKFRYSPLHAKKQTIKTKEIEDYQVVKTPFLAKLSGWDVQFSTREQVYSLSGRTGLELRLKDGQQIFIGTQKPIVLKNALDKVFGVSKLEVA